MKSNKIYKNSDGVIMIPDFSEKQAKMDFVYKNLDTIMAMKKSSKKQNVTGLSGMFYTKDNNNKFLEKGEENGVIKASIIGNTYYWMDSHDDVHVQNTFKKSISENKNIFHLKDHNFETDSEIGIIQSVEQKEIDWSYFNVKKEGKTKIILANSNVLKSYNEKSYNRYLNKRANQHSVGMYYVNLKFASSDPSLTKEYEEFNKHYDLIGNQQKVDELGYYFAVYEAKLSEISNVLLGSNELTGTYEPSNDTQKSNEHTHSTEPSLNEIIKQIKL